MAETILESSTGKPGESYGAVALRLINAANERARAMHRRAQKAEADPQHKMA
jgi:hypothetical protein